MNLSILLIFKINFFIFHLLSIVLYLNPSAQIKQKHWYLKLSVFVSAWITKFKISEHSKTLDLKRREISLGSF
jgi:hypothetical protein